MRSLFYEIPVPEGKYILSAHVHHMRTEFPNCVSISFLRLENSLTCVVPGTVLTLGDSKGENYFGSSRNFGPGADCIAWNHETLLLL